MAGIEPGSLLAGKYVVERVLGQGGMGVVLAARHVQLEERVAIKLMLQGFAANHEAVARFVREARAAAKIKSEHVVRVFDVGTLEHGEPYMVMECLEGSDLGAMLVKRGRIPVEEATEYLLQACEAIAEAHALGIIHRDLKPGNLFLTRRRDSTPLLKVLDFGISKVSGSSAAQADRDITRTSALMGSPLYMSPEQMNSARDVDARSDIWALGVILYELLAGGPPFDAPTMPQVCALILQGSAPNLRERVPELPEEIARVVARCLVRDAGGRFANVAELARALLPFAPKRARVSFDRIAAALGAGPDELPVASTGPAVGAVPNVGTNAAWSETSPPRRGHPGRVLAAASLALLLVFGLTAVFLLRQSPPREGQASTSAVPAAAQLDTKASAGEAPLPRLESSVPVTNVAAPVASEAREPAHPTTRVLPGPVPRAPKPPTSGRASASAKVAPAPAVPKDSPSLPTPPPPSTTTKPNSLGGRL